MKAVEMFPTPSQSSGWHHRKIWLQGSVNPLLLSHWGQTCPFLGLPDENAALLSTQLPNPARCENLGDLGIL